jgi:RNA polymerase sigma-70 factor (ECF subfamily)
MPLDRSEDEARWSAWMAAAQRGDEASYAQLLNELGDVIAAFLRAQFGDLELIEDCVQECLLAVHQARHTYDPTRRFRPWLFAIVRHKAIDMLRARRAYGTMLDAAATSSALIGNGADRETDGEDEVVGGRLFSALAPQQRQALTLTKVIGLSIAEAADRLGISQSALKVRVHRGIGAMRKLLEAQS